MENDTLHTITPDTNGYPQNTSAPGIFGVPLPPFSGVRPNLLASQNEAQTLFHPERPPTQPQTPEQEP